MYVAESGKSMNFGGKYLVLGLTDADEIWQLDREDLSVYHHPD